MHQSDVRPLVAYHRWARVAGLTPWQCASPISHGSIRDLLLHMLDTRWFWRLAAQTGLAPARILSAQAFPTLRTASAREGKELTAFVEQLDDRRVNDLVSYRWPQARPRSEVLGQLLMHIVTHGTAHRALLSNRLTTVGHRADHLDFLRFVAKASASA